jgi:RNA polymerase sigma-70 factor (ECF subfamily)
MTATLDQVRPWIVALLPRLRRFARTIARDWDDADDLVQLSIERALQRYEQWRPDSKFESWMFGIVRNAWIDEVRTRQRRSRVLAAEEEGENIGGGLGEGHAEILSVQKALATLPEEQRMAIALVLIEGLSYKEAAQALDIPIGTLTSRLARGREALQALL